MKRKMRMGWFSFSCCEDSSIVFTELLNDHYDKWKNLIDIRYARILKKNNDMNDLDVAFVEGAISTKSSELKLKKIRKNCQKLVAVGSCAVTGLPSGQRNNFNAKIRKEISSALDSYDYRDKVAAVGEIVKVDEKVPGCPMNEGIFLNIMDKCIKEFAKDA